MRILHFVGRRRLPRDPDSGSTGGISRVALELARAQRDLGHEAWVVATAPERWEADWRGVRLIALEEPRWVPSISFAGKMAHLPTHLALLALCRSQRFDVVHGHETPYLRFVPARLRLSHVHNNPFWSEDDPAQWRSQRSEFRAYQRCSDLRVVVSEYVARQLREGKIRVLGLPEDDRAIRRVRVIHNGVDLGRFGRGFRSNWRSERRAAWEVSEREVVFLYAGAIAPDKGMLQLAHAFAELSDHLAEVRLVVAGGASLWGSNFAADQAQPTRYEMEVRTALQPADERGQVRWLGTVSAKDMPSTYAGADVVVMPSKQEAFPLAALESLATGRPLLAFAVGGIPEMLESKGGILVPPGDVEGLRTRMEELARDAGLRARLGEEAEDRAQQWTWRRAADALERMYDDSLGS